MEAVFSIIKYLAFGIVGLFGVLFVLTLLFGKRVRKKWEFEAEFRNAIGREIGEFDVELSQIEQDEKVDTLKAKLFLKHKDLRPGVPVQVTLDSEVVMEGTVETEGRVHLTTENLTVSHLEPSVGQHCTVTSSGLELCSADLVPD